MSDFLTNKLNVVFMEGVTLDEPIIPRCYTLTHSDETGDMFLDIGLKFAYNKIGSLRDEVLAEWTKIGNKYILKIDLYIDPPLGQSTSAEKRNEVFRKHLKLAIKSIVYGDKGFFYKYRELKESPIIVYFNSKQDAFNKIEFWGKVKDYIDNYIEDKNNMSKRDNDIRDEVYKNNYKEAIIALLIPYINRAIYYETKNRINFTREDVDLVSVEKSISSRNKDDYNISIHAYCKDEGYFKIDFIIISNRVEIKKVEKI